MFLPLTVNRNNRDYAIFQHFTFIIICYHCNMSVEFEDIDNYSKHRFQSRVVLGLPVTPKLITKLIKTGVVKDEMMAGKFLTIVVSIFIILAIMLFVITFKSETIQYHLSPDVIRILPEGAQQKIYESKK